MHLCDDGFTVCVVYAEEVYRAAHSIRAPPHTRHYTLHISISHTTHTHYRPNLPNNIVALGDPGSVTQSSTILEIPTVDPQRPRQSMFALSYDELDSLVRDFFQSKNSDRSANNLTQAPLLNSLCMAPVGSVYESRTPRNEESSKRAPFYPEYHSTSEMRTPH